jgi:RecB family exonuclease
VNRLYLGGFDGLEAALAEEVRAAKERDAFAPVTVVVGSAAVASCLPRTLAQRLGGLGNLRVITLHRLAAQLARAGGSRADRLLTPEAQARLVERIVAQVTSRPGSHFGPVAGMPGLARAFLRSIEDMRQATVSAQADWGALRGGLADAQAALSAYESALQTAGCTDRAGMFAAAVSTLAADPLAAEAVVPPDAPMMMYGLYDLPQSQRALIEALARLRPLSAFMPYLAAGRDYAEPGRVFFTGLGLAPVELSVAATTQTEALSVGDDQDEFLEVARRLRALQADGVRSHEVAVVTPTADRAEEIARGLRALGVPAARRLPPAGGAAARVLGLLDAASPAAGRPWARAAVIDFAALVALAGAGFGAAEVARWAEESRQAAVVAAEDWQRLADRRRYLAARLADLQAGREEGEGPVSAGAAQAVQVSLAAVDGLAGFIAAVTAALEGLPEQASWPQMVAGLSSLAVGPCKVPPDDPVLDALAELQDCGLVEDRVGLADAVRVVRDRLRRLSQPHGSVGRRGVAVLTPHEVRGLRFRAVLFTGLCSGGFPPSAPHDPVLPDTDRRDLARRLAVPLAEAGAREREADMLFALARNAAADVFVGLVPRRDASGAQRQPSRLAVELAEELTGRVAATEDFLRAPLAEAPLRRVPSGGLHAAFASGALEFPVGRRPADLRDLDIALLAALHAGDAGRSASGAPRGYLAEVCGAQGARRLLGRRLAGVSPGVLAWDGVFRSRAARRAIASAEMFAGPQAPTALQEYPRCPFSYYVLSVLGIEPVEEPEAMIEADRREVGKVVHRVLQRVFAAVAEGAGRDQAVAMVPSVAEQECAAAQRRGGLGLALVWQAQRAQLVEDLTLAVATDPCWSEPDGPQPSLFELTFGAGAAPVTVQLGDGRAMQFRGRIDRVDRSADGRRLRVLDYKTGKGSAEKDQVVAGRNIQLPVYRLACRTLLADARGARIDCAFRMVTRRRSHAEVVLAADEAVVLQDLADTAGGIRRLVESGIFPRVPASERMCEWCRAGYACDELKSTRQTKQRHPALAELAHLRQPVERSQAAVPAAEGDPDA